MISLNGIVGQSLRIPLYSSSLATGLSLSDFSIDAALDGSYLSSFSSDYSASLTEIDSSNYAKAYSLSITPDKEGILVLTLNYSSYEETYLIQISKESVSYLANKIKGSEGDYTLTVNDTGNSPIQGVAVKVYNSAQTSLLHVLKTDSDGEVTISAPAGDYKLVLSKPNYSFTNPKSITIVGNSVVEPSIVELIPSSASIGDVIAIKGLYFGTGTQVRFGSIHVTPSQISKNQDILLVEVPTGISGSSVEIGLRKDDPNSPGSYLISSSTLTLGIS